MKNKDYKSFFSKSHPLFLDKNGNLHYELVLGRCEEFSNRRGIKKFYCFENREEMESFKVKSAVFLNNMGKSNHPVVGINIVYYEGEIITEYFVAVILKETPFVTEKYMIQCEDEMYRIYRKYNLYSLQTVF